jgi:L-alanine-DL-glutamate epimerase-like enolase superfamily enzyme
MLGGKFRDKVRIYADTTESKDPKVYAQRMKERKEKMGLTWLKMDLGVEMVSDTPGTVTAQSDLSQWDMTQLPHPLLRCHCLACHEAIPEVTLFVRNRESSGTKHWNERRCGDSRLLRVLLTHDCTDN